MGMGAAAGEKAFPENMENIFWNHLSLGKWESKETDLNEKSYREGPLNDLRLGEWEIEETDTNEKCYREDFLQENKSEFEKSIWDSEENNVCSMCQEWEDVGDGFRFHLPNDIFTAPPLAASLNDEKNDTDTEEKEKNYSEEEENKEDPVEGGNQVAR